MCEAKSAREQCSLCFAHGRERRHSFRDGQIAKIAISPNFFLPLSYVALSDHGFMQFSHIKEQSPSDWETTMLQNVVLTIFHTQNIYHYLWKIVRTTLQCIVGLQLQGEGHEMEKNCGTNLPNIFPCFSNLLPGIGAQHNSRVWF